MTATREERSVAARNGEPSTVAGTVDLVKAYAKQETIGPLKGAGRWIGMGLAGAIVLGLGLALVLLGVLRLLQTEWVRSASGDLSWLSYTIVLVIALILIALAVSRINKDSLHKEPPEQGPQ